MAERTVELVGKFVYQADAIPRGSRNPRRINLRADAAYPIRHVGEGDVVTDAVRVRRGKSSGWTSYVGYGGRLWSPLSESGGLTAGARVSAKMLADNLADLFGEGTYDDHPIRNRFDARFAASGFFVPEDLQDESAFDGRILASNRSAALRRSVDAARHYLCVDDAVYTAAYEPVWRVKPGAQTLQIVRPGIGVGSGHPEMLAEDLMPFSRFAIFRIDRRDDAVAWLAAGGAGAVKFDGDAEVAHPEFLSRNDAAEAIRDRLPRFLEELLQCMPFLDPPPAEQWALLVRMAASVTAEESGLIARHPEDAAAAVAVCTAALKAAFVPASVIGRRSVAIEQGERIAERMAFEAARKPKLDVSESDAIEALGTGSSR